MAFDFSTNHSIIIFGDPPIIVTGFDRAGLQSMRRNWFSVVLFALALALQAFGPAAANVAMAQASAETRQSFALCLQSGGVSAGDYHPLPGQKDRHRDSCPLCQICCDGIASYEARLNQVAGRPSSGARSPGRRRTARCRRLVMSIRIRLAPLQSSPDPFEQQRL